MRPFLTLRSIIFAPNSAMQTAQVLHPCRVDRAKYHIQIPLPPKIDPSVTMMTVEEKPDVTYSDIGGCKEQIERMREVNPKSQTLRAAQFQDSEQPHTLHVTSNKSFTRATHTLRAMNCISVSREHLQTFKYFAKDCTLRRLWSSQCCTLRSLCSWELTLQRVSSAMGPQAQVTYHMNDERLASASDY